MRRREGVTLAAAFVLSLAGCAKVVVVPVPPAQAPAASGAAATSGQSKAARDSKIKAEGVFYALPRTVARVLVKADQEISQSAPYARFAAIFAPGAEPPCGTIKKCAALNGEPGKSTKYSLQQGATFSTFGEPDPTRVFMVKFTGGGTLDETLSLGWNEAGLLSTASASVTNRITDIVVSGVKLAASLATKAGAGSANPPGPNRRTFECDVTGSSNNDDWILRILSSNGTQITTSPLVANYCDLPAKDRAGHPDEDSRDDFDKDRDEEPLKRAYRAYQSRVAPLVDQRTAILTTSSNLLDPVKFLEKLDALIDQQLTPLFVGSKAKKTWEVPLEVRELTTGTLTKILGISEAAGVCTYKDKMAPDAKPAPEGFAVLAQGKCDKTVDLRVGYHPDRAEQLFDKIQHGVDEPDGDRSFRYVLPAQVKAEVSIGDTSYGTGVFAVAQLGHVVSLPSQRKSKTLAYDLAMIEATGGLKSFKLASTGVVDAGTVDALAGAGGTVLDARNVARKKAEDDEKTAATAADELTLLTRQNSLLKLKDEICELQKKYGLACTVQP